VDRPIIFDEEQTRTFDPLWGWRDALIALANLEQDLSGTIIGQMAGLVGTPTSPATLAINIGPGRVYQQSAVDSTSYGALASDPAIVQQQGSAAAQQVLLTTSALSAGQSQWALVQCQFAQVDQVAAGDPTGGLLLYFNSANPSQPFQGPGNDGQVQPTVRLGTVSITVVYGSPATTGSEVPPNPTSGWLPMYLVDLTFGQTQITSGNILTAGPSVGSNVPSNYPGAPFIAGLLNEHHKGTPGQAPQIDLTAEVKNNLPLTNLPASNTTGGGLPVFKRNAGNPNGNVAGNTNVNGANDMCWDVTNNLLYICTTTGTTTTAVWTSVVGASTSQFAGGTSTGSANAQVVATTTPAGFAKTPGQIVTFTVGPGPNTGATTLNVDGTGASAINKTGPIPLTGGELTIGEFVSVIWTGTVYLLQSAQLGQLATMNIGAFLKNDGSGNLTTNNGLTLGNDGNGGLTVQAATITPQMISVAGAPLPYVAAQTADNLHLTNDATNPTFAFNVSVGRVRDDSDATNLQLFAAMTKRLDQSWAGGTGNGACDASTKGINQTWHVYLIGKTGMVPTAISRTSNVASMTIANHGLGVGSGFRVQGQGGGFDGLGIATAVTTNSITWSNAGGNVSSGAPAATALVDGFDILASQSYPTPTLPASFNTKQCLGSFLTDGSANIRLVTQIGDKFIFTSSITDLNGINTTAARVSTPLTVPNGVAVHAMIRANLNANGLAVSTQFLALVEADVAVPAPVAGATPPGSCLTTTTSVGAASGGFEVTTDNAHSIAVRSSFAGSAFLSVETYAYRDPRRRMF
jgi:hypothetical protein